MSATHRPPQAEPQPHSLTWKCEAGRRGQEGGGGGFRPTWKYEALMAPMSW